MAYYDLLFPLAAVAEVAAAALIFRFEDVVHSVLALAAVFAVNAVLLAWLHQPLLALLQLLILVGGVTTYLFVGVSSGSYSRFRHTNVPMLLAATLLIFLLLGYGFARSGIALGHAQATGSLSRQGIAAYLGSDVPVMAFVAFMLFAAGLGSIVLLRKLSW